MLDRINEIPEWEVELMISGPITVGGNHISFQTEKGEENPFTTTITLTKIQQGAKCKLIARAYTQENANDVAIYFVGLAVDALSLKLNLPLYLNLSKSDYRFLPENVRRIVPENNWRESFSSGRQYSLRRRSFSRAISWYRKGLISEDPIDRVIAFWSAMESIGAIYYRDNDRTSRGIINKICDCFDQVWGSIDRWRVIPNNANVVNEFYRFRNGFSHGFMRVDIETIRDVVAQLPLFQNLVHAFLSDWERQGEQIEMDHPIPLVDNAD